MIVHMSKSTRSVIKHKRAEGIPDLDSIPEIALNKPSAFKARKKPKPGFYWRGERYDDERSLIKAVTLVARKLVRLHLQQPVDVVGRDGAGFTQQFNLARLELQLVDPPMRKAR
jgi:hypothetical protein